jgi:hypothetical protein
MWSEHRELMEQKLSGVAGEPGLPEPEKKTPFLESMGHFLRDCRPRSFSITLFNITVDW